jgi:hypothetical protein
MAKTSTGHHRTEWTGKPGIQPKQSGPNPAIIIPPQRPPSASAQKLATLYPGIGDWVMVNAERVPRDKRTDKHQFLFDHGVHGTYGRVVGAEVQGGIYMLKFESAKDSVWVPADSVDHADQVPPQAQQMQEPRKSPERMRKQRDGSYNLT